MAAILITRVRHTEEESRSLLATFIFEGRYGGPRVPRGIEPEFVSRFIRETLQPSSPPAAYAAVLDVLRFYERADVLPHLGKALTGYEARGADLVRSAYILQAIGELGTPGDATQAADYFDRILVAHPELSESVYPVYLDTLVSLAPAGSLARLLGRLAADLQTLRAGRYASEAGMMKYDSLAAVEHNNVPKTNVVIEIKKRLIAQPANARRAELVRIYLGLSTGGTILGIWAARLLRKEAMEGSPEPVNAEFGNALEAVDARKLGADRASFVVVRAVQAVMYFQGTLSPRQRRPDLAADALSGRANFLSDL
jgi:hypothetical protein